MWAALFAVLGPLIQGLLQALFAQAAKPTTATVPTATASDGVKDKQAGDTFRNFPGWKPSLLLLPLLFLQGCWDRQVVIATPGIPMMLAEDVPSAHVFIRDPGSPDAAPTYTEYTGTLKAGMIVTFDSDHWTLKNIGDSQHFVPVYAKPK